MYAWPMERFYLSSISTCLKSGALLFVAGVLIVLAIRAAEWTVIGGVAAISVGAIVYGRSLARAGFDAMLVRLSQYSKAKALMVMLGAIMLNGLAYVTLVAIGFAGLDLSLDLARILALIAAVAFLPTSVFIVTQIEFERQS